MPRTVRRGPRRAGSEKGCIFDGVDDLITVADSNSLDLTSAMTLMAWVKVENQTGWRDILFKQNGSEPGLRGVRQ